MSFYAVKCLKRGVVSCCLSVYGSAMTAVALNSLLMFVNPSQLLGSRGDTILVWWATPACQEHIYLKQIPSSETDHQNLLYFKHCELLWLGLFFCCSMSRRQKETSSEHEPWWM